MMCPNFRHKKWSTYLCGPVYLLLALELLYDLAICRQLSHQLDRLRLLHFTVQIFKEVYGIERSVLLKKKEKERDLWFTVPSQRKGMHKKSNVGLGLGTSFM